MKYEHEDYLNSGVYGDDYSEIENYEEKVSKCRKPHKCMGGCGIEINSGDYALVETGFMDGKPMRAYTCLTCIEKWLVESGQRIGEEEKDNV